MPKSVSEVEKAVEQVRQVPEENPPSKKTDNLASKTDGRQSVVESLDITDDGDIEPESKQEKKLNLLLELDSIYDWLKQRRNRWPVETQPDFKDAVIRILEQIEEDN